MAWLELAHQAIQGDAKAVAAGYPAVANPSAEEVGMAVGAAEEAVAAVLDARRAEKEAREALKAQRKEANQLIRKIVTELDHTLCHLKPPAQRDIERSYGLHYEKTQSGDGEEAVGEPQTAAMEEATAVEPAGETAAISGTHMAMPAPVSGSRDGDGGTAVDETLLLSESDGHGEEGRRLEAVTTSGRLEAVTMNLRAH